MADITALSPHTSEVKINKLRAVLAVPVVALWCLIGAVSMLFCKGFGLAATHRFPLLWHGFMCHLFSMQVEYEGKLETSRPTLYVSNHASYLDVFVLGAKLPGAFVAKSEVASWPVFGKLARLQNTLFLERKTHRAASQIEQVRHHLHQQSNVILFPEGTSTSGTWVATFRSSLFAAAAEGLIQPITVAYLDYDGKPMHQSQRDHYAWYLPNPSVPIPNKPFAAHFFNALGLRPSRVKVIFHKPIPMHSGERKQVAALSELTVREGLETMLAQPLANHEAHCKQASQNDEVDAVNEHQVQPKQ